MKKVILLVFILFSFNICYSQSGWYQIPSGITYSLSDVYFINELTGWAVSDSGRVYMTTTGGLSWTMQQIGSPDLYTINFANSTTGYIGGGLCLMQWTGISYLYKTTNQGLNWSFVYSGYGGDYIYWISSIAIINPETIFTASCGQYSLGGSVGNVAKSTNGGLNFSTGFGVGQHKSVLFINAQTGWTVANYGDDIGNKRSSILKTTNSGDNWTYQFRDTIKTINFYKIKFFDVNTGYALGNCNQPNRTLFFKSTNGGANWDTLIIPGSYSYSMFFTNASTGWICGYNYSDSTCIIKTTNGGLNWAGQKKGASNVGNSIFMVNDKVGYAVGPAGLVLKTVTGGIGDTITPKYFPLAVGNVYKYHFSSSAGFNYDHKIRIIKDTIINNRKYFVTSGGFPGLGGSILRYDSLTGNNYYRSNSGYCSYSPFEVIIDSLSSRKGDTINRCSSTYKRFCTDTTSGNIFGIPVKSKSFRWNGFEGYEIVGYSTGFGVTNYFIQDFQTIASDQLIGCYINGVLYGDTSDITYTVSGSVKYSDNNQPVTSGWVKAIKLDKGTGGIIIVDSAAIQPDGSYILTKVPQDSVDIGIYPNSTPPNDWVITYYPSTTYWEKATTLYPTGNLTNINIGAIRMNAATNNNSVNGKVMRLTNSPLGNLKDAVLYAKSGNTFVRCVMSDGNGIYHLNSLPVGSLKIIVNRLGFTSDSTTVNVTSTSNTDSINFYLNRVYVGVKKTENTIPTEFKLYQNYPNPFNPATIIRYSIPNDGFLTGAFGNDKTVLKVYDILGKEVVMLVNEEQKPGVYEVMFDASNLPSGIYFYRLVAGDFAETKRMILVK